MECFIVVLGEHACHVRVFSHCFFFLTTLQFCVVWQNLIVIQSLLCGRKKKSISSFVTACRSPKVYFNCSTAGLGEAGLQCARTCLNLDADDCVSCGLSRSFSKCNNKECIQVCDPIIAIYPSSQDSMECESGCQCPAGLLDDGKGSCVKQSDCPCQHDGRLYVPGTPIPNECNTWYVLSNTPHVHSCTFYLIITFKRLHFHPSLTYLVPAKVESGSAQRKNVLELALFMGVATTAHMIRPNMGFKETVLTLLSR